MRGRSAFRPWHEGQFGPEGHLALGLGRMRGAVVEGRVRGQAEAEDVVEAMGGVEVEAPVREPRPDAMGLERKEVDGLGRGGQLRIGLAEALGIPEVDPRLIAQLDRGVGRESGGNPTDGAVFGLLAEVGVEVEDVEVPDAVKPGPPGQMVPDLVVDRARDDPGIGQVKAAQGCKPALQMRALRDDGTQSPVLCRGVSPGEAKMVGHSPG